MRYFLIITALLAVMGCQQSNTEEDKVLARVHNRELMLSELDGMFPEGTSKEDSTLIMNAFASRWVRETLILHEAERNLPKDLNIDKLVRDYRASLIRHTYEEVLLEELLDSTISKSELQAFYEKNKEQYQLETPIIRCNLIKVPLPVENEDSLRLWWRDTSQVSLQKLEAYCATYGVTCFLQDSVWHRVDDTAIELPAGTLTADNSDTRFDLRRKDDNFLYYFRTFEHRNRKEIAPLGYVEEQARKVILHSRKIKLLEEKREDLYDLEMRRQNIEILIE